MVIPFKKPSKSPQYGTANGVEFRNETQKGGKAFRWRKRNLRCESSRIVSGQKNTAETNLAAKRWPEGFVCPKFGHKHGCLLSNGKYQCTYCQRQNSVTARTVMHHSHVCLTKWFLAIYVMAPDKRGIFAIQLANLIGVTYKTAWGMLRGLRSAMEQRERTHVLSSVVEFDDAYLDGQKKEGRKAEKPKKQRFLLRCPWTSGAIPSTPKWALQKISSRLPQNALPKISLRRGYTTGR